MSDRSRPSSTTTAAYAARLVLGAVLVVLLGGPVATAVARPGPTDRTAGISAQAGDPGDPEAAPRLQPAGNGDTIGSPDDPDDGARPDRGIWWRIGFGLALVVVVLVALIQRRQTPERASGFGNRRRDRPGDGNAVGR